MELYGLEQGRKVARRGKAQRDVLLYAMPASMLDPIAKLEITPAPTRVKRFLLVRYEL
jgi:ABC-type phosphate transport system ATPase subunit